MNREVELLIEQEARQSEKNVSSIEEFIFSLNLNFGSQTF